MTNCVLGVGILSVPERQQRLKQLLGQLNLPESIVSLDIKHEGHVINWWRAADIAMSLPLAGNKKPTHALVIEDDAEPCSDFLPVVQKLIEVYPDLTISFFTRDPVVKTAAVGELVEVDDVPTDLAVVYPVKWLKAVKSDYIKRMDDFARNKRRMGYGADELRRELRPDKQVWATVPSLVDMVAQPRVLWDIVTRLTLLPDLLVLKQVPYQLTGKLFNVNIVAVIPTLGERAELASLLAQLEEENIEAITINRPEVRNIHKLWNDGVRQALDLGVDYLAILNDDIKLQPNTLATLQQAMADQNFDCAGIDPKAKFGLPDQPKIKAVTGTVGDLMVGVTTWCFMIKAKAWVDIDERYQWWWGVGDLFTKIQANGGKLGQLSGLGILHVGSGTASKHHWTEAAKRQDGKLWRELH